MFPFQNVSDIPRWQQLQCQEQHQLTKHTVSFKNIEKSEKKDFIREITQIDKVVKMIVFVKKKNYTKWKDCKKFVKYKVNS